MILLVSIAGISLHFHTMYFNSIYSYDKGLFNLRGRDIESTPVFYSYAIITQNELYLYLLNADERYTDAIDNFFFMEKILVIVKEYNGTRAGINEMVCKKITII